MLLVNHRIMLLRCSGGKCLTITAITTALSAASNPSKILTLILPTNKVKLSLDP